MDVGFGMKRRRQFLIGSFLGVGLVAWIAFYLLQGMRFSPSQRKSARALAIVCSFYASEHDGRYPDTKDQLAAGWGNELDILWNPGGGVEYGLRPGLTASSPPHSIVIYSLTPVRYRQHYVVRLDGFGDFVDWNTLAGEINPTGRQPGPGADPSPAER